MLCQAEKPLDLAPVKAHHRLPINEGDGCRPEPHLQQLLESGLICPDILVHKRDALARKKLFLLVARPSAGLRVHDHLLGHCLLLYTPQFLAMALPDSPPLREALERRSDIAGSSCASTLRV